MIINDFETVQLADNLNKPPHLKNYSSVEGFEVFHSEFDTNIYVVFNHEKNIYNAFRYVGELENLNSNMDLMIKGIFVNKK